MRHKSVDIPIVAVIALAGGTVTLVAPSNWAPMRILALPLVLVLPGYALTSALFSHRPLGFPERLAFSLGLSISVTILGGLLLNSTPFGLSTSSWAVFLSTLTLGACAVALIRQRLQHVSASPPQRSRHPNGVPSSRVKAHGLTFQPVLLGLAALIVGGAVALSIISAQHQPRTGFTQLWILPAGSSTSARHAVRLGVSNMESTAMKYHLTVNLDGKIAKDWPSVDLNPNQKWEATLVLLQTTPAGPGRVEAILYLTGAPTKIYRDVVLWLGTT